MKWTNRHYLSEKAIYWKNLPAIQTQCTGERGGGEEKEIYLIYQILNTVQLDTKHDLLVQPLKGRSVNSPILRKIQLYRTQPLLELPAQTKEKSTGGNSGRWEKTTSSWAAGLSWAARKERGPGWGAPTPRDACEPRGAASCFQPVNYSFPINPISPHRVSCNLWINLTQKTICLYSLHILVAQIWLNNLPSNLTLITN